MIDLVTRLRTWVHAVDAVPASDLMDQAADEIERLRGYRDAAESDLTVAIIAAERLRLTDLELAAVQRAAKDENDFGLVYTADVLRSLLDRLSQNGGCPEPDNAANSDTVGRTLARRITGLQSTLEADPRFSLQSEKPTIGEKPTLTDEERDSLKFAINQMKYIRADSAAATLRALLERTT